MVGPVKNHGEPYAGYIPLQDDVPEIEVGKIHCPIAHSLKCGKRLIEDE
jgi:hypothetical protein